MMCNKIKVIVDDLKKEHGDKITFSNVTMNSAEANQAVTESKLKSHGIIAKDPAGNIVKTVEGHNFGKAKVEKVVKVLLTDS